ncbi:hypothetical protein KP509_10G035900 [Ceratopteris richardii]|uniref:FAS1 domain-containing protein n=1 Tax=Ceratopteris richardii TaxID=49495 RepID=A0A8T2TWG9_CERRI|nr:hypothetical protein KP509_10G035900 [Ceratopteris richardii]
MLVVLFLLSTLPKAAATDELAAYEQMIVGVLREHGFLMLATSIQLADSPLISETRLPTSFTLFAPSDMAMVSVHLKPELLLPLLRYHISPNRLEMGDLLTMPLGMRIGTLLPGSSLLVTSNNTSTRPFTIDNVPIVLPDIFVGDMLVIHGINHVFDAQSFGFGFGMPILLPPPMPIARPVSSPPPFFPFLPPIPGLPPLPGILPYPNFPSPPAKRKNSESASASRQSPIFHFPQQNPPLP